MALNKKVLFCIDDDLFLKLRDLEKHLGVASKSAIPRLLITDYHRSIFGDRPLDYDEVKTPAAPVGKTRASAPTKIILRLEGEKPPRQKPPVDY